MRVARGGVDEHMSANVCANVCSDCCSVGSVGEKGGDDEQHGGCGWVVCRWCRW